MTAESQPKRKPGPPRRVSGCGPTLAAVVFVVIFLPLWYITGMGFGLSSQRMPVSAHVAVALVAAVPAAIAWAIGRYAEKNPPSEGGPDR